MTEIIKTFKNIQFASKVQTVLRKSTQKILNIVCSLVTNRIFF